MIDKYSCNSAGQETYQSLLSDAMGEAEGFVLVYSITDRDSFEKVKKLRERVAMVQNDTVPIILVGNKADLEHERRVPTNEGQELATSFGCPFIEVSAKTGLRIEALFETIVVNVRKSKGLPESALPINPTPNTNPNLQTLTVDSTSPSSAPSSPVASPNKRSPRKGSKNESVSPNVHGASPRKKKDCVLQ